MRKRRFYFHFRSPYSWIGACWMEKLRGRVEVEYVPFWEIDHETRSMLAAAGGGHSYTPMSKAKHLYILQDVKRLTERFGLKLAWPPSPDNQHWEVPHLAYISARREGKAEPFFAEIHRQRWNLGRDVCDPSVVGEAASACGLDPERIAGAWREPSVREEGVAELLKADADGVFGIPFFVHGYQKFWGIDRFELFVKSLQREFPEAGPVEGIPLPVYETDHPGGCG